MAGEERFIQVDILRLKEAGKEPEQRLKMNHPDYGFGYNAGVDHERIMAIRAGSYSLHDATFAGTGEVIVVGRTDSPVPLRGPLAVDPQRDKLQSIDAQRRVTSTNG